MHFSFKNFLYFYARYDKAQQHSISSLIIKPITINVVGLCYIYQPSTTEGFFFSYKIE